MAYFAKGWMSPFRAERDSLSVFGSALLFIFISQVITGVFLALYYVPSADHAHTTVAYITKEVTLRLVSKKHPRLWFQRDGDPSSAARYADVPVRFLQRTARAVVAFRLRALRVGAL